MGERAVVAAAVKQFVNTSPNFVYHLFIAKLRSAIRIKATRGADTHLGNGSTIEFNVLLVLTGAQLYLVNGLACIIASL